MLGYLVSLVHDWYLQNQDTEHSRFWEVILYRHICFYDKLVLFCEVSVTGVGWGREHLSQKNSFLRKSRSLPTEGEMCGRTKFSRLSHVRKLVTAYTMHAIARPDEMLCYTCLSRKTCVLWELSCFSLCHWVCWTLIWLHGLFGEFIHGAAVSKDRGLHTAGHTTVAGPTGQDTAAGVD